MACGLGLGLEYGYGYVAIRAILRITGFINGAKIMIYPATLACCMKSLINACSLLLPVHGAFAGRLGRLRLNDFCSQIKENGAHFTVFGCITTFLVFFWAAYVKFARIQLKKSGTRVPRVELEEVGPAADLVLRRSKIASDDLYRRAKKQPDAAKVWIFMSGQAFS